MNLQVLWALTGILSVIFVNADVCDNIYTQQAALQRCYDDQGIDYVIPLATEQMKNALLNTSVVCNDPAAFIRSGLCAANISRSCAPKEVVALVPSSTQFIKSINYLCSHVAELKPDCIQSHLGEAQACALKEALKNSTDAPDFSKDFTKAICRTYTISSVCANYHLRDCGLRSRLVYRAYNEYLIPDACRHPSTIIG
ncbi:hypothetical protein SNE40_016761 [Patella caerulea]|uniref:Uncharacterized protein n=1 Tax=Patella caerulea TaxID=87958 RepID=A0AAN8J983_PATCE